MVLAGIDTYPKGGQHQHDQEPFYSRHDNLSIGQQVHLAFDDLVTIEGLVHGIVLLQPFYSRHS